MRTWKAKLAFAGGAFLAAVGAWLSHSRIADANRIEFESAAENRISAIRRQFEQDLRTIQRVALYLGHSKAPASEGLQTYAAPNLSAGGGLEAIGWLPAERAAEVRPGEADSASVDFLEIRDGSLLVRPFDFRDVPGLTAYLQRAIPMPETFVSPRLVRHGSPGARIGVLVAEPVFTAASRQPRSVRRLRGFVLAVLDTADLVEGALGYLRPSGVHISLFDWSAAPGQRLLFFHPSRAERNPRKAPSEVDVDSSQTLALGGAFGFANRQYRIFCTPVSSFGKDTRAEPLFLLVLGLLLSFLTARSLSGLATEAERVRRLVEDRTKELQAANQMLESEIENKKQAEAALLASRDQALEWSRLKSEFLANMSHEFRTPMNGIIGMSGLLAETELDAEQKEMIQAVHSLSGDLLQLLNGVLDFSSLETGRLHMEIADFPTGSLIRDLYKLFAQTAIQKGLRFSISVSPGVPGGFRGDAARLRQAVGNLIENAIKFTHHGCVDVYVSCDAGTGGRTRLRFRVCDTGVGISPDSQKRIFDAFAQADGSSTRKVGGIGLGLSVSQQLCRLMNGELGCHSVPGGGSEFWAVVELQAISQFGATIHHDILNLAGDLRDLSRQSESTDASAAAPTTPATGQAVN